MLALLGIVGMFQAPGALTISELSTRFTAHLMKLIPGHLEFATGDSITNMVLGVVSLVAGFLPR